MRQVRSIAAHQSGDRFAGPQRHWGATAAMDDRTEQLEDLPDYGLPLYDWCVRQRQLIDATAQS